MSFIYLILGFFVKILTGLDDTLVHMPVLSNITKTRIGKLAYSLGTLAAISLAIVVSIFFSYLISGLVYYKYIAAGLIFTLAVLIYYDFLIHNPRKKEEKKLLELKKISTARFFKLLGIGFIASFVTVIDDVVAYIPLLHGDFQIKLFSVIGILTAAVLEIILVIFFSEKISKIKYKKEIATLGLLVLGILILTEII